MTATLGDPRFRHPVNSQIAMTGDVQNWRVSEVRGKFCAGWCLELSKELPVSILKVVQCLCVSRMCGIVSTIPVRVD